MFDWLSANGSIVAAFLSVIATALAAYATWRAPISAALTAEMLRRDANKRDEELRLKRAVFFTLMQERARMTSAPAVQAFNSIDVIFVGDVKVREAWADLYHHFNTRNVNVEIAEQKVRDLLREMAGALGLSENLRRDDFSRIYYPTAMADEHYVQALQRLNTKRELEGRLGSPVANAIPQVEATDGI